MTVLAWLLVISSSLWIGFGLVAVLRVRSAARRHPSAARPPSLPAVSILKPLCGADAALADSLTSFFEQDHPDFELVFGVESPADPAIAVVRALQRRYPEIPCRLVVHDGGKAVNPKVRNLLGMLPHARHELLLISDSNVRAPRHYASEMVATFQTDPTVGLVTSLFAGTDENTLGSALETVQLNGFCAAGATLPTTFGSAAVVGKSMLLSRHTFADLGGLERVADVLAEDYVMGKMFQHGGHRIRIAPTVLANVTADMTLGAFLRRHLRWGMLRVRLLPAAFLLEPLASPVVLLPLAWLALGPWALAWALAMLWLRDVGGWLALRGALVAARAARASAGLVPPRRVAPGPLQAPRHLARPPRAGRRGHAAVRLCALSPPPVRCRPSPQDAARPTASTLGGRGVNHHFPMIQMAT